MLEVETEIIAQYVTSGQVKIVYRHLQQLGLKSELLSEASECAADQGAFWPYRFALYQRLDQAYGDTEAVALNAATDLGLDSAALKACIDDDTHLAQVQADFAAAQAEGIRSRPVFQIGEELLIGARQFATFAQLIDAALAE